MAVHRLVFDATDATSIAASSNVGAYLRSADGTLLTHTDVGGKKALDVRVAEGINVEVDLSHVDDSVKVGDGTDFLAINADGSVNITDNGGSLTVDATDLDIRNLDSTTDSVSAWTKDGSGNSIGSTAGALNVNISSGSITTSDAALANTAIKAVAETVGTSAGQIVDLTDLLASRKYLYVYNNSNKMTYIGESGVTTSSGFPVPPGSLLEARVGASVAVYMIGEAASLNVRTLQAS